MSHKSAPSTVSTIGIDIGRELPSCRLRSARGDHLAYLHLVNVETRAPLLQMSSSPPPSGAAGVKPLLIEFYLPCSRICAPNLGSRHPLTTITGARRASGQTHSRARSHQATPTSVPTAPHPNPFHPSGCARAHENSFDDLVGAGE